jgi:hypothetical protein
VVGGLLLVVSAGLAQPEVQANAVGNKPEGGAIPPNEGPIGAQAAPGVSIAAPSAAIGDFGASQGNIWDMNSTSDIVATQYDASGHTIELSQPSPGIVRGVTPEGDDLAIAFYANPSVNLTSSQYHHLLYKLTIAPEGSCVTNGRVMYARRWPNWLGYQVITRAFSPPCAYGNFCLYYMDLSRSYNDSLAPFYTTWFSDPPPWPTDAVKAFGMWPHEKWDIGCSGGPNYFDLDYVYLTGDIVARATDGYTYTVKWNVSDPDGGTVTSTLRYSATTELQLATASPPCTGSNFAAWTYITQTTISLLPSPSYPNKIYLPIIMGGTYGGIGPYNQSYVWSLSGSSFKDGGVYYVCVEVDDGTTKQYGVSTAPVLRAPLPPDFGPG